MPSLRDLGKGGLYELGALRPGDDIPAGKGEQILELVNLWADSFGAQRLSMYTIARTTKTLSVSTASYTIGAGGNINITPRPSVISSAKLIHDTTATTPSESPIDVLEDGEYADWPMKTQTGQPRAIYSDLAFTAGLGRLYVLPIPIVATHQLVLYTPAQAVGQFADLDTVYYFPPGGALAIRYQIALLLSNPWGVALPPDLKQFAKDAMGVFLRANIRPTHRKNDPALCGGRGRFDIQTGDWR